jgi:hypothetical protein
MANPEIRAHKEYDRVRGRLGCEQLSNLGS